MLFGIVVLHVGIIYVLNVGLATQMVEVAFGPIETKMIEEVKQEEEKPLPPPPKLETEPPPFVPPPDIDITLPPEPTTTTAITATTKKPVPKPPPRAVVRTRPKQNPRRPIGEPNYPAQSRRLGEEGIVKIAFCVEPNGRVTNVKVAKGSGFPRLDEAAVKHMERSTLRLVPGTEDGKPVRMCISVPIRFQLK